MFQVSAHNLSLSLSLSVSLSTHNASAMANIILIKTDKTSLNLSEHQNVINYTPTADSLRVDVHVARIAKDKHTFLRQFNTLINSQLLRTVNH